MRITQNSLPTYAPTTRNTSASSSTTSFAAVMNETINRAESSNGADNKAAVATRRDTSSMTPAEMRTFAKELYNSGKIDQEALMSLTIVGPIGKAGPNGEFIPFTESERAVIDNTPVNYNQIANMSIARIESDGRALDPTSGYQTWLAIRTALNQYQQGA